MFKHLDTEHLECARPGKRGSGAASVVLACPLRFSERNNEQVVRLLVKGHEPDPLDAGRRGSEGGHRDPRGLLGRKLAVTIHQARLGPVEFTFIRPAQPLVHSVLADHDRHLGAHLDQDAAQRIGGLWTFAASSPRYLIHLPIRGNRAPAHELPDGGLRQLDHVLLHHSLQFAPSRYYPRFCSELPSNDGVLGDAREMLIEYGDEWDS